MKREGHTEAQIAEFESQLERVRPVTRRLIEAIMLDIWPDHTVIVDFGIDSQEHYEALYYPIRAGLILPLALDAALGHGELLTTLTREVASDPHVCVEFHTSWDVIFGRERRPAAMTPGHSRSAAETDASVGRDQPMPSPSEIAREPAGTPPESGLDPAAIGRGRGQE